MASSTVSIANRALQKLGAKRISSLTQDHPNARSMNAAFEQVRNAELRRYVWSFAIKRASIAADATDETILNTWKRYSLPNDFIRLIRDDESGFHVDWKIEGLYILSSTASPLKIKYVAKIEDPAYYDPLFIEALAAKLALECAVEIKDASVTDFSKIEDSYKTAISEARMLGAIEKPAEEFPEDSWLAARR
jgi:hypothetical protein